MDIAREATGAMQAPLHLHSMNVEVRTCFVPWGLAAPVKSNKDTTPSGTKAMEPFNIPRVCVSLGTTVWAGFGTAVLEDTMAVPLE